MYKLLLLSIFIINTYALDTITAVVPKNFPPYYTLDKNNKPNGFAIELLNSMAKEVDIKVNYVVKDSFNEVNKYFLEKKADVIPNAGISPEREKVSIFTNITDTFRIVAFKRFSDNIESLNDIKDKKVIVVKGNIGLKLMKDYPKNLLIIEENNKDAILSLLSARGDILIYPEIPILKILKQLNIQDKIVSFDKPLKEIKRAIRVQSDNPDLVEKLNLALAKIKNSGEYTKIYSKWFGIKNIVEMKKSDLDKIFISTLIIICLLIIVVFFLFRTLKLKKSINLLNNTLDNAIEAATLGIWEWDPIKNTAKCSDITYDIYGVNNNISLNLELIETLIHKDDLELHRQIINRTLKEKISFNFEYRIIKDNEIRIIHSIGKPIIKDNKIIKISGVIQDITEIKQAEKQLIHAQKISRIGHYDFNIKNNSFTTSSIMNDIFGVPKDYKKNYETWLELLHEDDKESMNNYFNHILGEKSTFDKEYRIRDFKTKAIKWVHGLGVIIYDKNNTPYRMFGTIQDITQRKQYETHMKQALIVFENTNEGIMITNSKNEIININSAFTKTTGYTKEDVLGKKPSILKSYIYPNNFYAQMWEDIQVKGFWQGEITNKKKSGELYEEYLSINIITKENGEIENFIGIFSDISILKQQEKMLMQQARTSAIGEMIGNIAHQWRQPLSVISTASTGMKLQLEMNNEISTDETIDILDKINEQTQHLSKTIEDFRNFFSENLSNIVEFEINEVIEKVYGLVKDSFSNNFIEIKYDVEKEIYIEGNKNLLIQALINIYNNALDALKTRPDKEKRILFISAKKENSKLLIKIKDNGGGIPLAYIEKIFDPYFTTKHKSQGTGIGLYMTHQIINKQLHGTISAKNTSFEYKDKEYVGAEFTITI